MIATMTREDFLAELYPIIDRYADALDPDDIADLRETAQTMSRFPIGSWFSRRAQCGCLVGESIHRGALAWSRSPTGVRAGDYTPESIPLEELGTDADVAIVASAFPGVLYPGGDALVVILDGVPS